MVRAKKSFSSLFTSRGCNWGRLHCSIRGGDVQSHHTPYTIHHKPLLWTANIRAYCVQYSAIEVLCEFWVFVAIDRYFFSLWKLMKFSRCFFIFTSIRNFSIINIMRMLCAEPNRSSRKWCDEFIGETQHITNKIELNIIAKTEL